jgi:hypothetical protein
MVLLGLTKRTCWIDVTETQLVVRFGWIFRARVPRASIGAVGPDRGAVLGWGAHGWRGVWLVNGSSSGIVRIDLDPPGRARTVGYPVKLRALRVAVEDPEGLRAALTNLRG